MMNDSIFTFVGEFSTELMELAFSIENQLHDQPQSALMQARLYSEVLVKILSTAEDLETVYSLKHSERIHNLFRQDIIDEEIYTKLEFIRKKGNKAVHTIKEADVLDAIQVHKFLFELSVWYMEVYVSFDFKAPSYKVPSNSTSTYLQEKEVEEFIKPYLDHTLQQIEEVRREVHEQLEALKSERKINLSETKPKIVSTKPESKMNISNLIDVFNKNHFTKKNETKKAIEFENNRTKELIYLLPNKEISIVLNPTTIRDSLKTEDKIRFSTALRKFPKKLNKGKTALSYGYMYKFKSESELDTFLEFYFSTALPK
ncbi:hypothetical protein CJ195_17135 [Bacillus sp. UMB0899]|nr:hypothetical protein CJ195_17135 [Bacillus sp. UMB0899]